MNNDKVTARQVFVGFELAYITSQLALVILKMTHVIRWSWPAVLIPTFIFAGAFAAILIAGTVIGIINAIRQERRRKSDP